MYTLEVHIGQKAFTDAVQAFQHMATAMDGLIDAASKPLSADLRKTLQLVARKMQQQHSASWNGGIVNQSDKLQRRSGEGLRAIANSIRVSGTGSVAALQGRITTGPMGIHETGGTIRAKSAGYLTIPLPAAMDARGVPLRKRAREWENTFVARSRKGNLLIFQKRGRDNIVPLYLLKTEVTIRPRLGMQKVIVGDALPYFERKAFETIERQLMMDF